MLKAANFQERAASVLIYTLSMQVPISIHLGEINQCCSLLGSLHTQITGQSSPTPLSDRWEPKGGVFQKQLPRVPPPACLDTWPPTWSSPQGWWLTAWDRWERWGEAEDSAETSGGWFYCQFTYFSSTIKNCVNQQVVSVHVMSERYEHQDAETRKTWNLR